MPFIATFGSGGGTIGGGLLPLVQSSNGVDVAFNDPAGTFTIDPLAQITLDLPQATVNNEMLHYDLSSSKWVSEPNVIIGNNASITDTNSITIGNSTQASNDSICISTNGSTAGGSLGDIIMITPNAEISVRNGGFVEVNTDVVVHNGGDTKNLKIFEDEYLVFNNVNYRMKNSVLARFLPTGINNPFPITLPILVQTDIGLVPNITNASGYWTAITSGLEYSGTRPLSCTITAYVTLGRQTPARLTAEFGVKINGAAIGGISTLGNLDRYRSNGVGVCSTLLTTTQQTINPGDTVTVYFRNQGVLGSPALQANISDCHLNIL